MRLRSRPRLLLVAIVACLLLAAPSAAARERSLFASQPWIAPGTAWFSIDLDSGALTKNGGMIDTAELPTVPGISPDGRQIYIPDYTNSLLSGFSIDSGGLTAVPGAPLATGTGPNAAVVEPEGRFVWSVNWDAGTLSGFARADDGSLSALPGYPIATGGVPTTMAISPNNRFTYLPNYTGDTIGGFERAVDGSLTQLAGFPLAHGGNPMDVEFSVDGKFLFVAEEATDTISSFSIDSATGSLTPVPGSPFPAPDMTVALAASPNGEYLVVAGENGAVWSMSIAGNGALAQITQTTAGNWPNDVTITPDGRFAYVSNYNSGTISGYAIDGDGALGTLPGSPFSDVSGPIQSFAIVPNQGPTASFGATVSGSSANFDGSASVDPDGTVASYVWDFGDGQTSTSNAAQVNHVYAGPGTYTAKLTVTDDEGCSGSQVGTGQTLYCNGSALAQIQHRVTIAAPAAPLALTAAQGQRVRSKRRRGRTVRRMRARYTLNADARVRIRFQKRCRNRGCARHAPGHLKRKVRFRNFGRRVTISGRLGRNSRVFSGRIGGRTLTRGRYRLRMYAFDSSGRRTKLVTTRSFYVR